jgi:hypothetical protein
MNELRELRRDADPSQRNLAELLSVPGNRSVRLPCRRSRTTTTSNCELSVVGSDSHKTA